MDIMQMCRLLDGWEFQGKMAADRCENLNKVKTQIKIVISRVHVQVGLKLQLNRLCCVC